MTDLGLFFSVDTSIVLYEVYPDSGYPGSLFSLSLSSPADNSNTEVWFTGGVKAQRSPFVFHWSVPQSASSGPLRIVREGVEVKAQPNFKILSHTSNHTFTSVSISLEGVIGNIVTGELGKDTIRRIDTLETLRSHIFRNGGAGRPNRGDSVIMDLKFKGAPGGCNCSATITAQGFALLDTNERKIRALRILFDSSFTYTADVDVKWQIRANDIDYVKSGDQIIGVLEGDALRSVLGTIKYETKTWANTYIGYYALVDVLEITDSAKLTIVLAP